MRNFSILALLAVSIGFAGVDSAGAAGSTGGMGDPSASMRYNQMICDLQRRGEYPRYHDACLPDYQPPGDKR